MCVAAAWLDSDTASNVQGEGDDHSAHWAGTNGWIRHHFQTSTVVDHFFLSKYR